MLKTILFVLNILFKACFKNGIFTTLIFYILLIGLICVNSSSEKWEFFNARIRMQLKLVNATFFPAKRLPWVVRCLITPSEVSLPLEGLTG